MNSSQFLRYLKANGCTVDRAQGKGGHVVVRRGDRFAVVPQHGGAKQLGTGLMKAIKKQLGLD